MQLEHSLYCRCALVFLYRLASMCNQNNQYNKDVFLYWHIVYVYNNWFHTVIQLCLVIHVSQTSV